jgi:hypothetical protein
MRTPVGKEYALNNKEYALFQCEQCFKKIKRMKNAGSIIRYFNAMELKRSNVFYN